MKEQEIENVYSTIFSNMYFTEYQKGIDSYGWYYNERNDKWLPLLPHQMVLFDFRNNNTELRPKSLSKHQTLTTTERMVIVEEISNNYSMLKKGKGIFHAQLFSAMEDYLKECIKDNKELTGL